MPHIPSLRLHANISPLCFHPHPSFPFTSTRFDQPEVANGVQTQDNSGPLHTAQIRQVTLGEFAALIKEVLLDLKMLLLACDASNIWNVLFSFWHLCLADILFASCHNQSYYSSPPLLQQNITLSFDRRKIGHMCTNTQYIIKNNGRKMLFSGPLCSLNPLAPAMAQETNKVQATWTFSQMIDGCVPFEREQK